ncbi:MAG: hypothetical protein ACFE9L_04665 [Candidatus Hodarchaeota archaeon]
MSNNEELMELGKETNESDPPETQLAVWISLVSFLVMFFGFTCWGYLYFAPLSTDLATIFIVTLLGSTFTGVTIFFFSTGNYLYFRFQIVELPTHWLFQGIFRTVMQIYYIVSYLIIFLSSQRFYSYSRLEFFIIFILFALPVIIGYPFARWQKIRNWFEQLVTNYLKRNTDLIMDVE